METKREIRKRILCERDLMTNMQVMDKSEAIFNRLCSLSQYKRAETVMAYVSYRNEVSTLGFLAKAIGDGKRIVLPKVEKIGAETGNTLKSVRENATGAKAETDIKVKPDISELVLHIYEIHDMEKDILPGFKGIPEPLGDPADRVEPGEIDLAVIPGVAFDSKKYRIGYGGGFYDRFIPSLRQDCLKAGVAFQMQLLSKIQGESFDIPVDMVITENMII